MAVIAPPRRPDSHDAEFTVEPDRGGEALIGEAEQQAWMGLPPVVDRAEVEALIREARRRTRRRRATIGVVVVAALASLVWATMLAFRLGEATDAHGPELGALQADAVPLTPAPHGELAASFYTHWSAGGDHWIYVYEDGRVISKQGGWVQQRLTSHGVELLRAAIIASGLLGPDRYAQAPEPGAGAFVQLRIDGVLTAAWRPPRTAEAEVEAFHATIGHLIRFQAWLPTEAWAERDRETYVPQGYAVCAAGDDRTFPVAGQDAVLPHLPEDAAAVLASSRRFEAIDAEVDAFAGSGSVPSSDIVGCRHLTLRQAQAVVDALVRGGWGIDGYSPRAMGEPVVLAERERLDPFGMTTDIPGVGSVHVSFTTILPHGVPECACYG